MKLVSACLLGIRCSYDGKSKVNRRILEMAEKEILIPVCPEQLGGLPAPRACQEIQGGGGNNVLDGKCKVKNKDGRDVTKEFIRGAKGTLKLAKLFGIKEFIGKAKSPSCGLGLIYDGSFSKKLIKGDGVTVALLKRNGIKVITEENLKNYFEIRQLNYSKTSSSPPGLYSGSGATLAKDVKFALEKLGIRVKEIKESEIKTKLKNLETLIIPGGHTEEILKALGKKGIKEIRNFVKGGGKYIGICAGAYLAPRRTILWRGEKPGLNIIDIKNERRSGIEIREIEISNKSHPLAKGYKEKIEIWYQNGPYIKPPKENLRFPTGQAGKGVEVIARYDKNFAAIVYSNYGKGKVILFSPHPEGSLENKIDPAELRSLNLLKNAINF